MILEEYCKSIVSPGEGSFNLVYDLVLGLPAILFLWFLGWEFRACVRKLQRTQSPVQATTYALLCLVALLNGLRAVLQALESLRTEHIAVWNGLWLLTIFGFSLLEVSVIAFLLQGNLAGERQILLRTLGIASTLAILGGLSAIFILSHSHVALYSDGGEVELSYSKWGFWVANSLPFLVAYLAVAVLPFTKWQGMVPINAATAKFLAFMIVLKLLATFGAFLLGSGSSNGYCIFGISQILYIAAYPPAVYLAFLADFFRNSESDLDMLLYSEMKDAGVFDSHDYNF